MFKTYRLYICLSVLAVLALSTIYLSRYRAPAAEVIAAAEEPLLPPAFGKLPLSFIENRGQADDRVTHYIQAPGKTIYFTELGHAMRFNKGRDEEAKEHVIKVDLVGASTKAVESRQRSAGVVSYFKGQKKDWKTSIPTHNRIGYKQPWAGIDLAYDGSGGKLESIYTVAPNADPSRIRLRYSGQDSLSIDDQGNLVYATSVGDIKETAPVAWQDIDGKRMPVQTRFTLSDENTVGFEVAEYDRGQPLTIDPSLVYATYLGGILRDHGGRIVVDDEGCAYVSGYTASTETTFPETVGPSTAHSGSYDGFVAKFNAAGTALVYAGYIGGSGYDDVGGIAIDGRGYAYITGATGSDEHTFPVSGDLPQVFNGVLDAYVAKIERDGSALLFAGYIGGTAVDYGSGIDLDAEGNMYIAGTTASDENSFPVVTGPLTVYGGGAVDVFVARVDASARAIVYAGYIGGQGNDEIADIKVDDAGYAHVSGRTMSTENTGFPVVVGPDLTHNSPGFSTDIFVSKVEPYGREFTYSGFIGGARRDDGFAIALDNEGAAYITGRTDSPHNLGTPFPVLVGPDLTYNGNISVEERRFDSYVVKVKPDGTGLDYAGYIGGEFTEYGFAIAVDDKGCAYVTGLTYSDESTFPAVVGPDVTFNGYLDTFIAKVSPSGHTFIYAGYIGGDDTDNAGGVAVDTQGNAYVSGETLSTQSTFPDGNGFGSVPGFDQVQNGDGDAYVVKIAARPPPAPYDFDGDGKSDLSVFRDSDNTWYWTKSSDGTYPAYTWGLPTDKLVPADYDGDGKTDHAIYRPSTGTWWIFNSSDATTRLEYVGNSTDLPRPADFNGDKKADVTIWRPSTGDWWVQSTPGGSLVTTHFGTTGDEPMMGDYDRDGKDDLTIFRPSTGYWWVLRSSNGATTADAFGLSGDIPIGGDFHNDGRSDFAVFRPSDHTWYVARPTGVPSLNYDATPFGNSTDIPVAGDYDGDGKTDIAVVSSGDWWILRSQAGLQITTFGYSTDKPIPAAYLP